MIICISGDYRGGKSGYATVLSEMTRIPHYSMRSFKDRKNTAYNTDFVDWSADITDDENIVINRYIAETARNGNCVLDFRFAAVICVNEGIPYTGIWISSSMESRVYGNSYCWKKSATETGRIIRERERAEKEACLRYCAADYTDTSYYHYFVDLSSYWYPIEEVSKRGFLFHDTILEMKNTLENKMKEGHCYGEHH